MEEGKNTKISNLQFKPPMQLQAQYYATQTPDLVCYNIVVVIKSCAFGGLSCNN